MTDIAKNSLLNALVDAFLAWPLPPNLCVDPCAGMTNYPHRSGTNLLSAIETKQMLEEVVLPIMGVGFSPEVVVSIGNDTVQFSTVIDHYQIINGRICIQAHIPQDNLDSYASALNSRANHG